MRSNYYYVQTALTSASAIGCVFTALLITQLERGMCNKGKPGRCATLLVVRALCMADIGFGLYRLATAFTALRGDVWCELSSFFSQSTATAIVLFNFIIALDVLRSVRRPLGYRSADAHLPRFVLLATIIAVVLGVVVTLPGVLSVNKLHIAVSQSCWVSGKNVLIFYVPLWAAQLFSITVLGFFVVKMQRAMRKQQAHKLSSRQKLVHRMTLFTGIFVLQWLPLSVIRINLLAGTKPPAYLYDTAPLFLDSIGLCDMLIWYGPICNQAARERVPISEISVLMGIVRERWSAHRAPRERSSAGVLRVRARELTDSEADSEAADSSAGGLELPHFEMADRKMSSPLAQGVNPGV